MKKMSKKRLLEMNIIPWDDVKESMDTATYREFMKWMRGKTCVAEGVYKWDLEHFTESYRRQHIVI